mmetsp:Transcript_33639/g.24662  ORF Transcript_33639/g.24662 Transcript_33639/m.24662 type:complete len:88 (+) Transcript_33639:156-419(+)
MKDAANSAEEQKRHFLRPERSRPSRSQSEESNSSDDDEGYSMKKSLRPRKVTNYKNMVDGDEITLKTILEEQNELRQKYKDLKEEDL